MHTHPAPGRLTCETCASVYDVHQGWVITRERDTIDCMVCGEPFIEWNGAVVYSAMLVTAAPWPPKRPPKLPPTDA